MNNYSEKFEKMRIAGKLAAQTLDMLTDIIKEGISVRKTEKICRKYKKLKNPKEREVESLLKHDSALEGVADNLRSQFKTRIKILGSVQKGKIEISYFSLVEFERIIKELGG